MPSQLLVGAIDEREMCASLLTDTLSFHKPDSYIRFDDIALQNNHSPWMVQLSAGPMAVSQNCRDYTSSQSQEEYN